MYFEAILFLAGAVLFFLAVLFFMFLWQDRSTLARRREELRDELDVLKEERVELDIWERELQVWALGLEHQQAAIAKAEEELKMLTAAKQAPDPTVSSQGAPREGGDGSRREHSTRTPGEPPPADPTTKNIKQGAKHTKLQA